MSEDRHTPGTHRTITAEEVEALMASRAERDGAGRAAKANQSAVWLFPEHDPPLVVKAPAGQGLLRRLSRRLIRREHRLYRRLDGAPGLPRCYGLFRGEWLVLEHHPGAKARGSDLRSPGGVADAPAALADLRTAIAAMHRRGLAHTDLKRQANLIVRPDGHLIVIDLGAAATRRPGTRGSPLWRWAAQQDWNAWARHGWDHPGAMPPAVARLHRRTALERWARVGKRIKKWVKRL